MLLFSRDNTISLVWYILAYLPVGLPVIKKAWESILQKDFFSEFTLMSVATLGAFILVNIRRELPLCYFIRLVNYFRIKR